MLALGLDPSQVAELAIDGYTQHFSVQGFEGVVAIGERGDLRRADESEIEGVEEQHHVLAAVLGQGDLFELLVNHCGSGEIRGLEANAEDAGGHGETQRNNNRLSGFIPYKPL